MDYPSKKAEFARLTTATTVPIAPTIVTVTERDRLLDGSGTYVCPECDGPARLLPATARCPQCGVHLEWNVKDARA